MADKRALQQADVVRNPYRWGKLTACGVKDTAGNTWWIATQVG